MGGYDAQTIVGATSTSTHGSGITFGPLNEMIKSIEIVTSGSKIFRIEASDGLTIPDKFKAKFPHRTLVQDDDWYNAVVVGLGCMGLVYSVIVEVTDAFYLKEVRRMSKWSDIRKILLQGGGIDKSEHFELLLNPHQDVAGDHDCLITTRDTVQKEDGLRPKDKNRNVLTEMLSGINLVAKIALGLFNKKPEMTEKRLDKAIRALVDDSYVNKSYKVFNIGNANNLPSHSSEIGIDLANNQYIKAVDRLLEVIHENSKEGRLYHTGPISLRFVKRTEALLSMMYRRDTCMIEIIMLQNTKGALEMYEILEKEMHAFDARIHWGQIQSITSREVSKMYPALGKWKQINSQLNASGVFNNSFSDRTGLSHNP